MTKRKKIETNVTPQTKEKSNDPAYMTKEHQLNLQKPQDEKKLL